MTFLVLCSYLSFFSLSLYSLSVLFILPFCSCFCSFLFALVFFSYSVIFSSLFYMLLLFLLLIFFYILIPFFFSYSFTFIYFFLIFIFLNYFLSSLIRLYSFTISVNTCIFPAIFQLRNRIKIISSRLLLFL